MRSQSSPTNRIVRVLLALGLLLLPIGQAIPAAAAPAAQTPGVLVIDTTAESESMDPAFVTQVSGNSVMSSIFDSLVERGYDGSIQPMLAESWSYPDSTTVEFKLRQGVTFHNGEPFHAGAVKFSIDRLMDKSLAAPLAGAMPKTFQGVEVVDDFTVRFHFTAPEASIFDALAQCCAIVPPGYYSENSREFVAANPIGSGPFRFVEWVRDDHTTVAANPGYWGGDTFKGTAQVGSVIFRPVPSAGTRIADLLNGTADMIFDVSPDDVDTVRGMASSGFQIVPNPAARLQFIEFMPKKATDPLADRRVRQALNYAIDVQAMVDNLFKGLGTRAASPILNGSLGYDSTVLPYEYNPTLARQLLADAGYGQGFSLTMDMSSSDNPAAGLAVVGQLKEIGVDVTPRTLELATFNGNWSPEKSGDLRIARWGGMQDPAVFLGFTTICGGFLADPFTCNADATALAKQAAGTQDQDARAALYSQISRILRDDPMGIYLSNAVSIYGLGPRVQGWRGATGRDYVIPTNITLTQ
ncbi:MAG TPA: ABC transporter substrate-binding protein [Chloroflexota bacterium]|jgi:peptide/nickel transport system substrate-binding protein